LIISSKCFLRTGVIVPAKPFRLSVIMVNVSVIWVKVVMPEKSLEVNTFLKIPWCQLYCLSYLKISLCLYGHLQYPKILCVDLDHQSKSTNADLSLKPMPFSFNTFILSLSPQSATSRSLSLCSLPNSPLCSTCIDFT